MQVFTTVPLTELVDAGRLFAELEAVGYDGAFTYDMRPATTRSSR